LQVSGAPTAVFSRSCSSVSGRRYSVCGMVLCPEEWHVSSVRPILSYKTYRISRANTKIQLFWVLCYREVCETYLNRKFGLDGYLPFLVIFSVSWNRDLKSNLKLTHTKLILKWKIKVPLCLKMQYFLFI
jgi:hypothetical protein